MHTNSCLMTPNLLQAKLHMHSNIYASSENDSRVGRESERELVSSWGLAGSMSDNDKKKIVAKLRKQILTKQADRSALLNLRKLIPFFAHFLNSTNFMLKSFMFV